MLKPAFFRGIIRPNSFSKAMVEYHSLIRVSFVKFGFIESLQGQYVLLNDVGGFYETSIVYSIIGRAKACSIKCGITRKFFRPCFREPIYQDSSLH